MARTDINRPIQDLQSDDGAVLWSFVLGEQMEYPITLNFLSNAYGFEYEAVLAEADNIEGSEEVPNNIKTGGIKTALNVRVPPEKGTWSNSTPYTREDVVFHNGLYYKLRSGVDRISAITPPDDPLWEEYVPNKVYIQFTKALGSDWAAKPTASTPVYGFFELRVTEPAGGVFQRTWKPVRGVVSFSFSPTEML